MSFYAKGLVRIHYEEVGSGFPLLLIPGGGLNSALSSWQTASPFNPMERYKDDFRCICADLRNANPGQSSGPLEIDRPWDAYTDDQLGLMDHLGIREFMVMGFCIGGPMIHNLIRRAPERVVAAAMMQPSGFRPEIPDLFYQNNIKGWGPQLCAKRADVTMDMVHDFLTSMYTKRADFVFTVSRDFVRSIRTPLLIAPDDVPAHPYKVAMEVASLAPKAEVTIYPWKDSPEHIDEVVEHARRFLKAHEPVRAQPMSEGRFSRLTAETMTPEQKRVAEAIQSGPRGAGLRGPFNALLRSPELCDLVQRVGAFVRFGTSIPARVNELAIIMAGRKWTAQYEFYAHRRLAIEAGLKPAIADAIAAGTRPTGMAEDEAIAYDFVSELLATGQVSDAAFARVKAAFGERGVIDLVGAVGYYSLVSMVLNVARVPLPAGVEPPLK